MTVGFRYKIVSRLGKGSSGSVYLAKNLITNENVAIKVAKADDYAGVMQLQNESKILRILSRESSVAALKSFALLANFAYLVIDLAKVSLQN